MSDGPKSAQEAAAEKGLVIFEPSSNEIQIDLDSPEDRGSLDAGLEILKSRMAVHVVRETVSSGGNAHVYITVGYALSDLERICLQACLGSDRKREILSFLHVFDHELEPASVLFETKEVAEKIQTESELTF